MRLMNNCVRLPQNWIWQVVNRRLSCKHYRMKKISMVFAVGIVMAALAGCVPGETVVTISADDVGCVMTGGVGCAKVVTTLKSSIPKFDLSKMSKKNLARV